MTDLPTTRFIILLDLLGSQSSSVFSATEHPAGNSKSQGGSPINRHCALHQNLTFLLIIMNPHWAQCFHINIYIYMTIFKMMWGLAGTNMILLAQFKWMPLKFDVCMHWRVTDGDEVRGEWGRWVTSVNPHSAVAAGLRTKWPGALNLSASKLHLESKELPNLHQPENTVPKCSIHTVQDIFNKKVQHLVLSIRLYACEHVGRSLIWGVILFKWSPSPVEKENPLLFVFIAYHSLCCFSCCYCVIPVGQVCLYGSWTAYICGHRLPNAPCLSWSTSAQPNPYLNFLVRCPPQQLRILMKARLNSMLKVV